ncbi:MAG: cytochrome c family protein [Pseudomonadota bacterium]|nr:cytochrome c family protein [Pseudomonadota bacterium]
MLAASAAWANSGEAVFKRNCAICHSLDPGKNRVGPSLAGVVGRHAGTVDDFSYSSANKTSGIVWTKAKLDEYLTDPQKMVPGTLMVFPGLKNPNDRRAIIDFLAENPGS